MWLVKSAGRIEGPIHLDDLRERVRRREVVAHDEVMTSFGRWRYVREQSELTQAVEEALSGAGSEREDTLTETGTEEIVRPGFHDPVLDVVAHPSHLRTPERSFPPHDSTTPSSLSTVSSSRWVPALLALGGIGIVAALVFLQPQTPTSKPSALTATRSEPQLTDLARAAWEVGDHGRAAQLYHQALSAEPNSPEIVMALASLMIQEEGQTLEAQRLLERIKDLRLSEVERGEWHVIRGLASFVDGDFEAAERSFAEAQVVLAKSLQGREAQPLAELARANMAASRSMRRNWEGTRDLIKSPFQDPSLQVVAALLLARGELLSESTGPSVALSALQEAPTQAPEFRYESLFFRTLLLGQQSKSAELADSLESLLDLDPSLSSQHGLPLLLVRDFFQPKQLYPLCQKFAQAHAGSVRAKALLATCKVRTGRWIEARRDFENLLTMSADPLLKAHFALALWKNGREIEARAVLKGISPGTLEFPRVVEALICDRQANRLCAEAAWRAVIQSHPKSLMGLAGLAQELRSSEPAESRRLLEEGLALSPRFLPFRQMARWNTK